MTGCSDAVAGVPHDGKEQEGDLLRLILRQIVSFQETTEGLRQEVAKLAGEVAALQLDSREARAARVRFEDQQTRLSGMLEASWWISGVQSQFSAVTRGNVPWMPGRGEDPHGD